MWNTPVRDATGFFYGIRAVAQGLARLVRDQDVGGSNPLSPTDRKAARFERLYSLYYKNSNTCPFHEIYPDALRPKAIGQSSVFSFIPKFISPGGPGYGDILTLRRQ